MTDKNIKDILNKYSRQLEGEIKLNDLNNSSYSEKDFSKEFLQFKQDMMPQISRYESWCQSLGNFLKIKLSEKDQDKLQVQINSARLDITPSQVVSLAFSSSFLFFFLFLLISVAIFFFTNTFPTIFIFLGLIVSFSGFYYFYSMPKRLSNKLRLRISSQMIPCILYIVVYMKHTSNLERAIQFASQHLDPPLSIDLKKIFWNIETGRFSTIKESLENYLESWRKDFPEFVESFNLIESSLYEASESRRITVLERSLQIILDGVYDKMLKYSHEVKAPLTNIYMLGVVLPTLGIALLPLASALLNGMIQWYHVVILFNFIVPFFVFYKVNEMMMQRPGGYGENTALELNPFYEEYSSNKPYLKAFLISFPFFLIGLIPFIFQFTGFPELVGLEKDYTFAQMGLNLGGLSQVKFFHFIESPGSFGGFVGPMGPVALFFSLFIPFSVCLFFSTAYLSKTKNLIKTREESKNLEKEFNNSLFQLGNRIGDGTPAELAFAKVSESSKGQITEEFFKTVNSNIQSLGMSVEKAIFDKRRGAIVFFPSSLIATSMHILVESVKKGLRVAAESLMSISEYIRNVKKIEDRLRDLMADVVSDMRSNMTFIAPLLAGVVVGLSSMITLILSKFKELSTVAGEGAEVAGLGNMGSLTSIFDLINMIPPYYLQICIGIYIIQIIFILSKALVTVDSGYDMLKEKNDIGKNLIFGGLLYLIVAFISILALSVLSAIALSGLGI